MSWLGPLGHLGSPADPRHLPFSPRWSVSDAGCGWTGPSGHHPSSRRPRPGVSGGPGQPLGGASLSCVVAAVCPYSLTTLPCAGVAQRGPCLLTERQEPESWAGVLFLRRVSGAGAAFLWLWEGSDPFIPAPSKVRARFGSCPYILRLWKTGRRREEIKAQKDECPIQGQGGNRVSQLLV